MAGFCGKYAVALAMGGLLIGAGGCAPAQVMNHSGQIGRFFGDGISFSVPVVRYAENVQQDDSFWEVRQGIGGVDVVVMGPFVKESAKDSFRENMVLTSHKLENGTEVEQFRQQQIELYAQEHPDRGSFVCAEDQSGYFATCEYQENGATVACRAWFFVDKERSLGYVLLGTVLKDANIDKYFADFAGIASTVRIGQPMSGFAWLDGALGKAVEAVGAGKEVAQGETTDGRAVSAGNVKEQAGNGKAKAGAGNMAASGESKTAGSEAGASGKV